MSKLQYAVLVALLALVVLTNTLGLSFHPPQPNFEYKTIDIPDETFIETMDTAGANGWELVFARRATSGDFNSGSKTVGVYEVIFKRPKRTL